MLKLWNIIRPGRERPTRSAIAFGLAFAVVLGLGSYWDLRQSDAGPRETATVVDRQRVEGRLRPLGVEYSPIRSDGPFALTLAMQLSGEHRRPGPEEFQVFVKPPVEDEQHVDELTVQW